MKHGHGLRSELYILRHGIAEERSKRDYPDDDRPLSKEGVQKMRKEARGIRRVIDSFDLILTSPLERAYRTAKIVGSRLGCSKKIKICRELSCGATPKRLAGLIAKYRDKDRLLLVGHEPDLSSFISYLLGSKDESIELKKGALCRLDVSLRAKQPEGTLVWLLTPQQLCLLANG